MLAVVAGLTLSGVATLSHDIWASVVRNGKCPESEQLLVARGATVLIALFAIVLGVLFEGQNVAFMAGLAFSIACAANFPALVLAIFWRRFTTPAAVASILTGTVVSLVLILLSPTVQVDLLGKEIESNWWFVPLRNPAIIAMPLSFGIAVAVSLFTSETAADDRFDEMRNRILFGAPRVPQAGLTHPHSRK
jgi:cation/acetate symporter